MKKNSMVTILLCGMVAMFVTAIFYLLAFEHIFTIPMRWLSLMWLLIVEAIGTIKALRVNRSIFGVAQITASIFHLLGVLILSVVFVNLLPLLIKQYVLLNVLMLSVVAILDILLMHFDNRAR